MSSALGDAPLTVPLTPLEQRRMRCDAPTMSMSIQVESGSAKRSQASPAGPGAPPTPKVLPRPHTLTRTRSGAKCHLEAVCEHHPPPPLSTARAAERRCHTVRCAALRCPAVPGRPPWPGLPYHRPANLTDAALPDPNGQSVPYWLLLVRALCASIRDAARYRARWRATLLVQEQRCSGTRADPPPPGLALLPFIGTA